MFSNFDINATGSKSIHTFGLSQEQDLQIVTLGIIIDKIWYCNINLVILFRNVNWYFFFKNCIYLKQLFNLFLRSFKITFHLLKLIEQIKLHSLRFIKTVLQALNFPTHGLHILLKTLTNIICIFQFFIKHRNLVFKLIYGGTMLNNNLVHIHHPFLQVIIGNFQFVIFLT